MKTKFKNIRLPILFAFISVLFSNYLRAQQEVQTIEDVITADVVAMASVDLTKVNLLKLHSWAAQLGLISDEQIDSLKMQSAAMQGFVGELVESGVERITVLLRVSDINEMSPLWIASVNARKDVANAKDAIAATLELIPVDPQTLVVENGLIVGGQNQTDVDSLLNGNVSVVSQLKNAIETSKRHTVSLIVFGNPDTRRVVREMLPELPPPFQDATAELIADDIAWGGIFLNLPPEGDLKIAFETSDNDSAKTVGRLAQSFLKYAIKHASPVYKNIVGKINVADLEPKIEETFVTIEGRTLFEDPDFLAGVIAYSQFKSGRSQRINDLKQIILAMHSYEAKHGKFPRAAIYSDAGEPLLSWRVAILPFLDQQELFEQFHLDEPWDSPNNMMLAEKMPEVYISSETSVASTETTVQVPFGTGLLFDGKQEISFADIKDGSVNTIAIVNTSPGQAVCWTKPADWKVDLENPWKGLKPTTGEGIAIAFADGSTYWFVLDRKDEDMRALLTRDGGEVVTAR